MLFGKISNGMDKQNRVVYVSHNHVSMVGIIC